MYAKYCGCYQNVPEASELLHLPREIIIMPKIKNDDSFTKLDFRPFQKHHQTLRLPRKMTSTSSSPFDPRLPTFWQCAESTTPATHEKVFDALHLSRRTCHAKRRSRPQNAPDVPHVPHEMDVGQKTSTAP